MRPDGKRIADSAGFVLAGGKSTRMGEDKALLSFQGRSLVEVAVRKLAAVAEQVSIAGNRPDLQPFGEVLPDAMEGCGPVGGMVAAMRIAGAQWRLFLPVDLPLIPEWFLREMLLCATRRGGGVLAAEVGGKLQPLCVVLHCSLGAALEAAACRGERKVLRALQGAAAATGSPLLRLRAEEVAQERGYTPEDARQWFLNANTPEELAECLEAASVAGRES